MHIPPAPNIFLYPSFTSHPISEYGPCFLCTPLSNTILLSQTMLVVALALLIFLLPIRQPVAIYKLGQALAVIWFLNLATLMGHAKWRYFTDPWATPWTQEKPDGVSQSGVRLLGVGYNAVSQVVVHGKYGAGLGVVRPAKRMMSSGKRASDRVGVGERRKERREEKLFAREK